MSTLHKHDGDVLSLIIPLIILALASIVLRFYSKTLSRQGIALDDWLLLTALTLYIGYWYTLLDGAIDGTQAVDPQALPLALEVKYLKLNYASSIMGIWGNTFAKFSMLWLYRRLFPTSGFRRANFLAFVFCLLWAIACSLATALRCIPVSSIWDPLGPPGSCFNLILYFQISEPLNMLSELLLVILPINVIRKLHMPLRQRVQISIAFAFGIFVICISIARLILIKNDPSSVEATQWLCIQATLALVAMSLPTYGHILSILRSWYISLVHRLSGPPDSQTQSGNNPLHAVDCGGREPVTDLYLTKTEGGGSMEDSTGDLPLDPVISGRTVGLF